MNAAMIPKNQREGENAIAGARRRDGQRRSAVRSSRRTLGSEVPGFGEFVLCLDGLMC